MDEKEHLIQLIHRKLRFFEKAIAKTNQSLEEGKAHDHAKHIAELIKANFHLLKQGLSAITVCDWSQDNKEVTIPLDSTATPKQQLEGLFKKCQKLKRSIIPLEKHLQHLHEQKSLWQIALQEIEPADSLTVIELIKQRLSISSAIKKEAPTQTVCPYHIFYSETGFQILVGKNSQSNHLLTFQAAHGSDLWLHAHSCSGAHVVIKKKTALEIDQKTVEDALQLALYFSKARSQSEHGHEVLITERKYVSRLHKAPKGKVMVSKHKIVTVFLDKARIDTIRRRPHRNT